jgi:hypothetical protein
MRDQVLHVIRVIKVTLKIGTDTCFFKVDVWEDVHHRLVCPGNPISPLSQAR